jgi:hypothetical protein
MSTSGDIAAVEGSAVAAATGSVATGANLTHIATAAIMSAIVARTQTLFGITTSYRKATCVRIAPWNFQSAASCYVIYLTLVANHDLIRI